MEAVGNTQTVAAGADIIFEAADDAGTGIDFSAPGTTFTITRPGLYHVEWSINLAPGNPQSVIGTMENGEPASALTSSAAVGNCSSGALIDVDDVPYTISLRNFGAPISVENPIALQNTAVSIRILRFADGASV